MNPTTANPSTAAATEIRADYSTAALAEPLDHAIAQALHWLVGEQQAEGFWAGMLESNCCMEAQWLLGMHFLGVQDDPKTPGVIRAILREQRPDGSWEVYHQAPMGDINTTVECYAALRSCGFKPDDEPLKKARASPASGWR
jgi:squalene-hopene/tetraprenyl-beta-curcumene cyclase